MPEIKKQGRVHPEKKVLIESSGRDRGRERSLDRKVVPDIVVKGASSRTVLETKRHTEGTKRGKFSAALDAAEKLVAGGAGLVPDAAAERVVRRGPRPDRPLRQMTLRELREAAGKTQVEMAEALGTDQAAISRLEQREDTSVSTLRKWMIALGLELELAVTSPYGHRVLLKI